MLQNAFVEELVMDIIDDVTCGLCFEIHRACKLGILFLDETDPEYVTNSSSAKSLLNILFTSCDVRSYLHCRAAYNASMAWSKHSNQRVEFEVLEFSFSCMLVRSLQKCSALKFQQILSIFSTLSVCGFFVIILVIQLKHLMLLILFIVSLPDIICTLKVLSQRFKLRIELPFPQNFAVESFQLFYCSSSFEQHDDFVCVFLQFKSFW